MPAIRLPTFLGDPKGDNFLGGGGLNLSVVIFTPWSHAIILPKMSLFDTVDDEFKLMVCAAYGDLQGINSYTGNTGQYDVNALMVAVANHQTDSADLLKTKFPHLTGKTPQHEWTWRQATHAFINSTVYLPSYDDLDRVN
eukprot:TRINITY_DN74_c0_g1_i1.p1 TRINITY_DN74_c0_g1~~TRINITY_DN74_c0_g1_i1.p1  ORF type:complete len:149 (+),score=11.03 TRINITY_DN74_c0_g1_i1:28-447(+)